MTKKTKKKIPKAKRGHITGGAKLTMMQVREIRYLFNTDRQSYRQLAEQYDISAQAIRNIILRFSWRDLPDE